MPAVQIRLLAFLSSRLEARLSHALPRMHRCASWNELERELRPDGRCIVFVDPSTDEHFCDRITKLRADAPAAAFVIYSSLEAGPIQRCLPMVGAGVSDVVFFGFDDRRERLEWLIDDIQARQPFPQFTSALEPYIGRLPPALRRTVNEMLRQPTLFHTTQDLARIAGMSTRVVFRQLKAAGFTSVRRLVAAARVAHAYPLLAERGRSAHEVATRLKYRSADQLSEHLAELTGFTARDLRRGVAADTFYASVMVALTQKPHVRKRPRLRSRVA